MNKQSCSKMSGDKINRSVGSVTSLPLLIIIDPSITDRPTIQPTDKHDGSLGSCAVADFFFVRPGVMVSRVSHLAFFKKL